MLPPELRIWQCSCMCLYTNPVRQGSIITKIIVNLEVRQKKWSGHNNSFRKHVWGKTMTEEFRCSLVIKSIWKATCQSSSNCPCAAHGSNHCHSQFKVIQNCYHNWGVPECVVQIMLSDPKWQYRLQHTTQQNKMWLPLNLCFSRYKPCWEIGKFGPEEVQAHFPYFCELTTEIPEQEHAVVHHAWFAVFYPVLFNGQYTNRSQSRDQNVIFQHFIQEKGFFCKQFFSIATTKFTMIHSEISLLLLLLNFLLLV